MECTSKLDRTMSVDIDFVNEEGMMEETQMDINAYDEQELSKLFAAFCKENKFPINTVIYVTIVKIADSMDELLSG